MRVYVSADIEGVAGVVSAEQTSPAGGAEYQRARRLMTREVNAAARAAFDTGTSAVVINDAHGPNTNVLVEELDERVELISGRPKALNMMHGVDEGFDAALFLGYHAQPGTAAAILDHAYLGSVVDAITLNGREYGEFGLNAMLAGAFGVPVVMASGDDKLAAEAAELLQDTEVVVVKWAQGRTAARTLTPATARVAIASAVTRALRALPASCRLAPPEPPLALDVRFVKTSQAELAALLPASERLDGRTVRYRDEDYVAAFRACRALLLLGSTAS
jgi:D-amino peptidase